jgi:hypothetical protein
MIYHQLMTQCPQPTPPKILLFPWQKHNHQLIKSNEHSLVPFSWCLSPALTLRCLLLLKLAILLASVNAHSSSLLFYSVLQGFFTLPLILELLKALSFSL